MKIAIHKTAGSFSDRWIPYCEENKIDYKIVNCYDNNIIHQLDDCDGLLWHWAHNDYKARLFARQLTLSLEKKKIEVFPDVNTSWHYDDKVGQKYLLEAINAPLIKSYVFYTKQDALEWINETTFPKVFKLRGGAGSSNVRLIRTKKNARKLSNKAFNKGFSSYNLVSHLKESFWVLRRDKNFSAIKGIPKVFKQVLMPKEFHRFSHNEKGYIYFQDFIPGLEYDTRLMVIGNRCFGIRRYCRKDDFRASGSGIKAFDPKLFDKRTIKIAFETAEKLKSQSVAFDFIMDNDQPEIVEISYCFTTGVLKNECPGYWDNDLNWHNKVVNIQNCMLDDFLEKIRKKQLPYNF